MKQIKRTSTTTRAPTAQARQLIEQQTAKFLRGGGEIQRIPQGISGQYPRVPGVQQPTTLPIGAPVRAKPVFKI